MDELLGKCPTFGRLIHDDGAADGARLSADPRKRLSWVFGPDCIRELAARNAAEEWCAVLGISAAWAREKRERGAAFRLALFPAPPDLSADEPATWPALFRSIEAAYPEAWPVVRRHREALQDTPLAAIFADSPYDPAEVHARGPADANFMSVERLLERGGTLAETRQFLWDEVGVKELFAGDGYTRRPDGSRGVLEYLVANRPLAELAGLAIAPVDFVAQ